MTTAAVERMFYVKVIDAPPPGDIDCGEVLAARDDPIRQSL
jgi:hypothetical protein